MKNLLLTLCLSLTISVSIAQSVFEKVLSNEIKLALSDGVRFDDGSWMFSAFAYSFTPGDSAMAMVLKTDSTFSPLWAKRYKTLRRDDFSCITLLKDGNVLVGGTMRQDFSLQDGGSVLKLDTSGNVIWHMMYDETFDDRVLDIFEQADSSLMIFIRKGVSNQPTKVIHANENGNILSQRTYIVDNNIGLLANNVVVDENEQYYFSGSVFEQGIQEMYVCAVDDNSLAWYKQFRFDERSISSFNSAYIPADQSIILGGTILDTVGIFVNIWLAKIDLQGNVLWAKEYGQDLGYTENASEIKPLPNGDFLIFGRVFDDQGSEGFAMRLDAMGNKIWERGYNPTSPTLGIGGAFLLPDGKMLINANSGEEVFLLTTSAEGENACSISNVSFNIANLSVVDSSYTLTQDNPGVQEYVPPLEISNVSIQDSLLCAASVGVEVFSERQLNIFPNPVRDQLTIVLPEGAKHNIECTIIDAFGRKINAETVFNTNEFVVDVTSIPTGIYWLYLNADGKVFSQSFVRQ